MVLTRLTAGILIVLLAACALSKSKLPTPEQAYGTKPVYNYPINDPYAATVVTLPPEMKVDYSAVPDTRDREMTLFRDRAIPEGFWYQRGLKFGELLQPRPAPLVYVVPGTGADSKATIMRTLACILYSAGYSVVLLPSPTNPNFIINASEDYLPGSPSQDARDLYRLMEAIDRDVSKQTKITGHMLMGYSLGAWEAAFTAKLDSDRGVLGFRKVLLINPPLSLYSSMRTLDKDLYRALPHGMDDAGGFVKGILTRLSRLSPNTEALDFQNGNLLLEAYNRYHPSDDRLATTIGLSFRLSAADMIFTSDVMRHSGYLFPKDQPFTTSTHLAGYLAVALRTGFIDYLNDEFFQAQHAQNPALTKQDLANAGDLQSLSGYLSHNPDIGMITNRDDIVLAPGELKVLVGLFGPNAYVFPNGGHLGNIGHPAMAYQILQFLK